MSIDPVTGVVTGTPPVDASQGGPNSDGVYDVTVTAIDPDGEEVSTTVTYSFANPTPVIATEVADQTAVDGEPVSIVPDFVDPDGDALSYSAAGLPAGLSIDPATGEITGTVDNSASQVNDGVYVVSVTADDGNGGTTTDEFTLSVTNPAPIVDTPIGPTAASDGDVVSITSAFSDPDGDVLTYTATGLPTGLSIDSATGEITGTIENSSSQGGPNGDGVYTVTVTADDGEGGTVTDTFEYIVTNPVPTAGDDALSASEDVAISGNVIAANDSDPDGDVLNIIEVAGNPANVGLPISGSTGGVFTIAADGAVTFDPNGDFDDLALGETATSTIAYMVSDGEGGTDTCLLYTSPSPRD